MITQSLLFYVGVVLTSSMRCNGAGRTAWVARFKASPTSAACPPLSEPGPLQGLPGSGLVRTEMPSLKRRVLPLSLSFRRRVCIWGGGGLWLFGNFCDQGKSTTVLHNTWQEKSPCCLGPHSGRDEEAPPFPKL